MATGSRKRRGTRNTPSLRNIAHAGEQFWDGRRRDLEAQALDPYTNPREHGLADRDELLDRIRTDRRYDSLMEAAYGKSAEDAEPADLARALSGYMISLKQTDSPLDRYLYKNDKDALNVSEQRGLALFRGRARCVECHVVTESGAPLADGQYHSLGLDLDRIAPRLAALTRTVAMLSPEEVYRRISSDADLAALGRFAVTRRPADIGKFKTPSLRNAADTAPYMHDGSLPTLEAALDRELYYRGKAQGHPIVLSLAERNDLLAFLRILKDLPGSPESGRPHGRTDLVTEK